MIVLHKLNNDEFALNSNHIETIEERPDTTITLVNEKKYIVKESYKEIYKKILIFNNQILSEFEDNNQ
jgi:flagellar protein FlbD